MTLPKIHGAFQRLATLAKSPKAMPKSPFQRAVHEDKIYDDLIVPEETLKKLYTSPKPEKTLQ